MQGIMSKRTLQADIYLYKESDDDHLAVFDRHRIAREIFLALVDQTRMLGGYPLTG